MVGREVDPSGPLRGGREAQKVRRGSTSSARVSPLGAYQRAYADHRAGGRGEAREGEDLVPRQEQTQRHGEGARGLE